MRFVVNKFALRRVLHRVIQLLPATIIPTREPIYVEVTLSSFPAAIFILVLHILSWCL
jgi:hypothetical protein